MYETCMYETSMYETSMYEPFMIDTCVRINLACIVIVNQIKL